MKRSVIFALCLASVGIAGAADKPTKAPRIWSDEALRDWPNVLSGINARPRLYSEAEYYAAPLDNLRSYPVYHPDFEPLGYLESLRKRGSEPLIEIGKARTRQEWIDAGSRVWDELDTVQVRTTDFRIVDY